MQRNVPLEMVLAEIRLRSPPRNRWMIGLKQLDRTAAGDFYYSDYEEGHSWNTPPKVWRQESMNSPDVLVQQMIAIVAAPDQKTTFHDSAKSVRAKANGYYVSHVLHLLQRANLIPLAVYEQLKAPLEGNSSTALITARTPVAPPVASSQIGSARAFRRLDFDTEPDLVVPVGSPIYRSPRLIPQDVGNGGGPGLFGEGTRLTRSTNELPINSLPDMSSLGRLVAWVPSSTESSARSAALTGDQAVSMMAEALGGVSRGGRNSAASLRSTVSSSGRTSTSSMSLATSSSGNSLGQSYPSSNSSDRRPRSSSAFQSPSTPAGQPTTAHLTQPARPARPPNPGRLPVRGAPTSETPRIIDHLQAAGRATNSPATPRRSPSVVTLQAAVRGSRSTPTTTSGSSTAASGDGKVPRASPVTPSPLRRNRVPGYRG